MPDTITIIRKKDGINDLVTMLIINGWIRRDCRTYRHPPSDPLSSCWLHKPVAAHQRQVWRYARLVPTNGTMH